MKIPLVIALLFIATWESTRATSLENVLAQFVKKGADDWISFFDFVRSAERKDTAKVGKVVVSTVLLEVLKKKFSVTNVVPQKVVNFNLFKENGTTSEILTSFTAKFPLEPQDFLCEVVIAAQIQPPNVFSIVIPALPKFELIGDTMKCNIPIVIKTGPPLDKYARKKVQHAPMHKVHHSPAKIPSKGHPFSGHVPHKHLILPHKVPLKHIATPHKASVSHKVPLKHLISPHKVSAPHKLPPKHLVSPHKVSAPHKLPLNTPHKLIPHHNAVLKQLTRPHTLLHHKVGTPVKKVPRSLDDVSESDDLSEVDDVSESDDLSEVDDDVSESDDLSEVDDDVSESDDLSEVYDDDSESDDNSD